MEVIGMFKNKTGRGQRVEELEKRKLRLLRSGQPFHASPISVDEPNQESIHEGSQICIKTAMLEAEYKKARTLAAFHNNHRFC